MEPRSVVSSGHEASLMSPSRKMTLSFRRGHRRFITSLTPVWILLMSIFCGNMVNAEQGPASSSYIPQQMIAPLTSAFMKLIPQFNPNAFTVQFKTDARIALSPTNPSFVPFLLQYQALAMNEIGQAGTDDVTIKNGMTTYFNSEYGRFISEVGLPVGCISFYAGATEMESVRKLESLSKTLNSGDASNNQNGQGMVGRRNSRLFSGIGGDELVHRLNLDLITEPFTEGGGSKPARAICDKIFWILKDGTVVAHLPSTDFSSRQVWIPTMAVAVNIYNTNVTHELSKYFSTGVSCYDDIITKRNFSSTVTKWMSSQLIPQVLQSPRCIPGFPRILQLLISIEMYKHTLVYVRRKQYAPAQYAPIPAPEVPPPSPVYYDDGDYYNNHPAQGEPYAGPLQPVRTGGAVGGGGPAQAGSSSTLLFILIVFLIIFGCCFCCCCLIPLCCPNMKTFQRLYKIYLRAKRSLANLRNQKPDPDYKPIFDDDEDGDEEDEETQSEEKPKRKKRLVRKKRAPRRKCKPNIQIPFPSCSDTSITICVTTEEECLSSSEVPQYDDCISRDMDTAYFRSYDEEDDTTPEEAATKKNKTQRRKIRRRNDDRKVPQKQFVEKSYAVSGKHMKPNLPEESEDFEVEDRYEDAARIPQKTPRRPSYETKGEGLLQNLKPDKVAPQSKEEYYDKLITHHWKYNRSNVKEKEGDTKRIDDQPNEDNLGPPPPPRQHKDKSVKKDKDYKNPFTS